MSDIRDFPHKLGTPAAATGPGPGSSEGKSEGDERKKGLHRILDSLKEAVERGEVSNLIGIAFGDSSSQEAQSFYLRYTGMETDTYRAIGLVESLKAHLLSGHLEPRE